MIQTRHYDPATYITRDLYREVIRTRDLRVVWAHVNAQKWQVDYDKFLALCPESCPVCQNKLHYGLGGNSPPEGKLDEHTPSTNHIIPQSLAPDRVYGCIDNLQIICARCNRYLNNATYKDIAILEGLIQLLKDNQPKYAKLMED